MMKKKMILRDSYQKTERKDNEEFYPILDTVIDIIMEQPLKEIRIGFSSHYCKLNCKDLKVFWRFNENRMNSKKLVFKTKDFEKEAEQNSWDEIEIKNKEIEVQTRATAIYFIFEKPITRIIKNKLKKNIQSEVLESEELKEAREIIEKWKRL